MSKVIAAGVESVNGCESVLRTVPPVSAVCEAVQPDIPAQGDIYATQSDLENCDGLILGSPTRFGTIAAPLKYYFDQCVPQWLNGALKDKPAAVFTSTSSQHGGQESTLLSMMLPLLHHGMLIIGIPYPGTPIGKTVSGGTPYGASHIANSNNSGNTSNGGGGALTAEEITSAKILGSRVANCARRLNSGCL